MYVDSRVRVVCLISRALDGNVVVLEYLNCTEPRFDSSLITSSFMLRWLSSSGIYI